jgi:hypothetical protein
MSGASRNASENRSRDRATRTGGLDELVTVRCRIAPTATPTTNAATTDTTHERFTKLEWGYT